jgi:hypothetical protein
MLVLYETPAGYSLFKVMCTQKTNGWIDDLARNVFLFFFFMQWNGILPWLPVLTFFFLLAHCSSLLALISIIIVALSLSHCLILLDS